MVRRRAILERVANLVGSDFKVTDPLNGWPGFAKLKLESSSAKIAIHVGPVGLSGRKRDAVERRFQNPGQNRPVKEPEGTLALLVGLWEEQNQPVLVAFRGANRVKKNTRFSLFCPLWLLKHAASTGWAEHENDSGEQIVAFHPALLPVYVELSLGETMVSAGRMIEVLAASGLVADPGETTIERTRRATSTLVRNAAFGKIVVGAYDGLCAMCGLNLGLCEGAHIYPASAPNSEDEVWNGLALCSNHHRAFDKHLILVEPDSREIRVHPELEASSAKSKASEAFVSSTLKVLNEPNDKSCRPLDKMFRERYQYYESGYVWAC